MTGTASVGKEVRSKVGQQMNSRNWYSASLERVVKRSRGSVRVCNLNERHGSETCALPSTSLICTRLKIEAGTKVKPNQPQESKTVSLMIFIKVRSLAKPLSYCKCRDER